MADVSIEVVKTLRTALAIILPAAIAVSTSATAIAQSDVAHANVAGATAPERVLFIGNSHTFTNGGINWHIGRMASTENPSAQFQGDTATISGATLAEHYELDSQGRIPEGAYDVVVLQGHIPVSADPSVAPFLEYARRFESIARENGARTVFFMSWPHIDHPRVKLNDIVRAHRRVSHELGADVAPVALAMQRVSKERPKLEMLSDDGVHASWAGSYLASAVIYATLFDRSPVGHPYTYGVDPDTAEYLQQVAWDTVSDWNASV